MSAQTKTVDMDLSIQAQKRNDMVTASLKNLQRLAYRARFVHQRSNDQVVIVCIQVDSEWRTLVNKLMPGYDWQQIKAQGLEPVARGIVSFNLCLELIDFFPDIAHVLMEIPDEKYYKCVALNEGGCTVYDIEPIL